MIMSGGSPLRSVRLKSHAKPNAPNVPSAYMRIMMPIFVMTGTVPVGTSAAIMSR